MRPTSTDHELYLLGSASVSLLPGVTVESSGLRDIDGHRYSANGVGRFLARSMQSPVMVTDLVTALVERYEIEQDAARADVSRYLADLNSQRLVSIRQSFPLEFLARLGRVLWDLVFAVMFRMPPSRTRYPDRRYRPSASRVVLGCLEAHQSTILLGLLVTALVGTLATVRNVRLGAPAATPSSAFMMLLPLLCFVGLVGSGVVHELGHYWAARRLNVPMASVFVRLGVSGLSHAEVTPARTAVVVAAGPLSGSAVGVAMTVGAWTMPTGWLGPLDVRGANIGLAACGAAVTLLQLNSLTPLSAEGRQLAVSTWRTVTRRPRVAAVSS
jgi:hypothetical protein